MRPLVLALLLMAATPAGHGQESSPLESLQASFTARRDDADRTRDAQLAALDNSYAAAVERQAARVRSGGQLDEVLPYVDEIQSVKTGPRPIAPLPATAPDALRQMRAKHEEAARRILQVHAEAVVALADRMTASLAARESALTKAGDIDAALAAKRMREALAGDRALGDARDLLAASRPGSTGAPVMQVRRGGDHIEVLVFRDRRGKISMDSPVRNTRERTGPGKELGDTRATTLGEFVGAEGYRGETRVLYHGILDRREAPGLTFNEIETDSRHEQEGVRGLRLSLKATAANPYGTLGNLLPTGVDKGAFRITSRYFVPQSNRALEGFSFVQGTGGAIGNFKFLQKGKWTTEEVVAESPGDTPVLLLYLTLKEGSQSADAIGDFLVLGELKVEQIRFSAYIQARLDTAGQAGAASATEQPALVTQGELVADATP